MSYERSSSALPTPISYYYSDTYQFVGWNKKEVLSYKYMEHTFPAVGWLMWLVYSN